MSSSAAPINMPALSARVAVLSLALVLLQGGAVQLAQWRGWTLQVAGSAWAEAPTKPEKTRKTPALRADVYERLNEAQELAEAGKSREALILLDGLRDSQGRRKLNSYELANLHNFYAYIYYQKERYPQAINAYRQVLAQPDLPLAMEEATHYSLAQLYFVQEDYSRAISSLNKWFLIVEKPQPDAYVLLAQAYYQNKNYDLALNNVEKAVRLAGEMGKPPRENWYLLMRALYYDKGNLKKVAWVLEELLRRWPKKEYLLQASGIYGELGRERRQVAAMESAYVMGWLAREQELLNMAYLFLGSDTPYKAARVLEKGMAAKAIASNAKHYELLGTALRAAQETQRAIPAMAKAADLADDAEPWARLANIYLDNDQFAKAAEAARIALKRGQLKRPDDTRLVLGMALFNMHQLEAARREFQRAAKYKRSEKTARNWIDYLDNELARLQSLKDGLSQLPPGAGASRLNLKAASERGIIG